MTFEDRKKLMIEYLKLKLEEHDWHGVCDAANDLRELEVEMRLSKMNGLLERDAPDILS